VITFKRTFMVYKRGCVPKTARDRVVETSQQGAAS
jgi:hypothetical protein